jgi:hypothetical protein
MGLYPVRLTLRSLPALIGENVLSGETGLCRNVDGIVAKLSACPALAKSSFILAKDATCARS